MPEFDIFDKPFTYEQGLSCSCPDYTLYLPDGFVVQEDTDRDFVAYLGGEGIAEASESPFAIYAGKSQSHDVFKDKCIPQVYEAFAYAITCSTSAKLRFEKLAYLISENPQVPGGISAGYDSKNIYYNAYFGCSHSIHPLRIDVSCPRDKRTQCDDMIIDLINHIQVSEDMEFLEMPDDKFYMNYGVSDTMAELWDGNINANIKQMSLSRNIRQNAMVNMYKEQQTKGIASLPSFKAELTDMLSGIVRQADKTIAAAETAYNTFIEETDDEAVKSKLKTSFTKLLDFADQSVVISGEELCVVSELAAEARKRLNGEPEEAAPERNDDFILAVTTEDDSDESNMQEEAPELVMARKEAALQEFVKNKKAELVREYKGRYEEADAILVRAQNVAQSAIDDAKDSIALLGRADADKKQELTLKLEEREERLYQLQLKQYELKKKYIEAVKTLPAYLEELKTEYKESLDKA